MILNFIYFDFIRLIRTIISFIIPSMNVINKEFKQVIKYGQNNYTEFLTGNMNLLISVPHDGSEMPDSITSRKSDKSNNLKRDLNTEKIAIEVRNHLKTLFKRERKIPFMIVNKLHRLKMDPNRDSESCCEVNSEPSFTAYSEYHDFISNDFENDFVKSNNCKNSLLIDLHGHNHSEKMVELGYLLSSNYLNNHSWIKRSKNTSISKLESLSKYKLEELIRGEVSFGAILKKHLPDLSIIPSPDNRFPSLEQKYYTGGFIISRYGSKCNFNDNNPIITAIQIELPQFMRSDANYSSYSLGLAKSVYEFYNFHNF
jgi:N-formylglutamate amidohydrolase